MIEVENLTVKLGGRVILSDISFAARAGELTAIVGPNGSGKTTLLRAVCGEIASTGAIRLNGRDMRRQKPWELAETRGVLPQKTALSFPFTVLEIVRLGLAGGWSRLPRAEAERLPLEALRRVDLAGFAGRFYQELSGGEQQRVQLARVLCQVWTPVLDGVPRWLFLDEPVSSLDIRHQLAIMELAADFACGGGGVVTVLHDLNLAAMFAEKIVMMRQGKAHAAGRPEDVLTDDLLAEVFECRLGVGAVPQAGAPFVLPQSARNVRAARA
ncbi:heme ABC transporter ATP-binding protein [Afifella sp. IM 167]|uniref:heme ABC transporter ATP-binding protein n=1 Tax=Afifella sp. IM 167 TaxID=2033586 RepID=UPI001CCE3B95|nr:heme ABC transporter ATP-binding protein [Afifella sp. IM 167]MBZ8134774.1 heme ABC transporter ATP-binding protein [Afifella sp. IM 167]